MEYLKTIIEALILASETPLSIEKIAEIIGNVDKKEVYHIGASLKDLGKKWFAFSKIEIDSLKFFEKLKKEDEK